MTQCKQCGAKLSSDKLHLLGLDDTFCSDECRAKFDAATPTSDGAQQHIQRLLQEMLPTAEWRSFGVCVWTSTGHKLGQSASLWAGRAFLGLAGDLLHVETSILGIAGLTADGTLAIARIGELGANETVRPESVYGTTVSKERAMTAPLTELRVSRLSNGLRIVRMSTGEALEEVVFPACFLVGNESFPALLNVDAVVAPVVTAPSVTGVRRKVLSKLLLSLSILLWLGIILSVVLGLVAGNDLERELFGKTRTGFGILFVGLLLAATWIAASVTKAWWNMSPPDTSTDDTSAPRPGARG